MRKILSPSSISLFIDCPRCFWLKFHKKISRPSGPFPSLPAGMDRILKTHFDKHRKKGTLPKEIQGVKGSLFSDLELLDLWRNNFRGLRYENSKTGFTLMGALDDLFVTDNGLYAPLDFKTRGYPLKEDTHEYYQNQMDMYTFLLSKNKRKPAGYAILLFYHPKRVNKSCNVEFNADTIKIKTNMNRAERIFNEAVKCLQGNEPKNEGDCPWCRMI